MEPKDRLKAGLVALLIIIVGGTLGYSLIDGFTPLDALYMTVITISTVGFREVGVLSTAGRIFTILLIIAGVGTVFFVFTSAAQKAIEGALKGFVGRRKMEKEVEKLHDHYIICGYGRMGRSICKELWKKTIPFVCIEKDGELIEKLKQEAFLWIHGDATEEEVLLRAGIERANGLVACVKSESENVFITLTARGLNPALCIVARAEDEGSERKLTRAGADKVISPYHIGGLRMAYSLLKPAVCDFIELVTSSEHLELEMEELPLRTLSPLPGLPLGDSKVREALGTSIIVAVKKSTGHMLFNPPPDTVMELGDTLIVLGKPDELKKLEELVGP